MSRKQRPKKGKVIRVSEDTWELLQSVRNGKETTTALVRRLLSGVSRKYVLPSSLHESLEEARGEAVVRAVRSRKRDIEEPIVIEVRSA